MELHEFHLPRWAELPQIALYMDQVLLVINGTLEPLTAEGPAVTATMINNYVKMKLVAPAEKKKYSREHVARFFLICLLKKVLSMTQIARLLEELLRDQPLETVYDLFCQELEARLNNLDSPSAATCPTLMALSVRAVVCKTVMELYLSR